MTKNNSVLTSFSDHLDQQYGKPGTLSREAYEEEFEVFKLGVLIRELREEKGLTQEAVAKRCGTTKSFISRLENHTSEFRLSTLMRVLRDGLDAHIKVSIF